MGYQPLHEHVITEHITHEGAPAFSDETSKAKPGYFSVETCVKRWKPSIPRNRHTSPESGGR